MNRRGIALLATLWLLAALSVVTAGALTLARVERGTAINRVALARGRWAAEGCLALVQARFAADSIPRAIDSTDLGGGLWCRASIEDLGARLGVNIANAAALTRVVGDSDRASALLDWIDPDDAPRANGAEAEWYRANGQEIPRNGPLASIEELRLIRGFDSATVARLSPLLSTRGTHRLNVNAAPRRLLVTLPGLDPGAVGVIIEHRDRAGPFRDLDGLLAILPASLRAPAMARFAELQGSISFTPERVLVHLEGHVPETSVTARTTIEAIPAPGRLAILAREEW